MVKNPTIRTLIWGISLFIVLEFIFFRSGLYSSILEPASYAGKFNLMIRQESARSLSSKGEFLVIGNSRIEEGFSEKIADETLQGKSIKLINGAIAGATPRVLYYLLRELDPDCRRYDGIILGVKSYPDYDGWEKLSDRLLDCRHLIARLNLIDIPEYVGTYRNFNDRVEVLSALLFKGFAFKHDIQAFLCDPMSRIEKVRDYNTYSAQWRYKYHGIDQKITGLSYNFQTREISFSPEFPEKYKYRTERMFLSRYAKPDGTMAEYNRYWYGKIVDRYENSATRIAFIKVPQFPMLNEFPLQKSQGSVIYDMAKQTDIIIIPENTFAFLEKQEYFFDGSHLNKEGRALFSRVLAEKIANIFENDNTN